MSGIRRPSQEELEKYEKNLEKDFVSESLTREEEKKQKPFQASTLHTEEFGLVEMVYDPTLRATKFVYLDSEGAPRYLTSYVRPTDQMSFVPIRAGNALVERGIIRFSVEPLTFDSDQALLHDVQTHVHRYLDVAPSIERIISRYVLFSWLADRFAELGYIRAIGDFGTGKSRLLRVVGSLCYKAIFANGSTSPSAIFRMLDEHQGTLILDEADFSESDEQADVIKILNCGFSKGTPVLKSEKMTRGSFEPRAFDTFGPKILATRFGFKDRALESRCITFDMPASRNIRRDIPRNLDQEMFEKEAQHLVGQLLMFRLKNWSNTHLAKNLDVYGLDPRSEQIATPLLSILVDAESVQDLSAHLGRQFDEIVSARGLGLDGQILESVIKLYQENIEEPTIKEVCDKCKELFIGDHEIDRLSPKLVGARLSTGFRVNTIRRSKGFVIPASERKKIDLASIRYGILKNTDGLEDDRSHRTKHTQSSLSTLENSLKNVESVGSEQINSDGMPVDGREGTDVNR